MMTSARRRQQRPTRRRSRTSGDSFASVYVDKAARLEAVQAAVDQLPMPIGVTKVAIDDRSVTDIFGCRIAIDLTGTFDETTEVRPSPAAMRGDYPTSSVSQHSHSTTCYALIPPSSSAEVASPMNMAMKAEAHPQHLSVRSFIE
jgi:hypothetical protein